MESDAAPATTRSRWNWPRIGLLLVALIEALGGLADLPILFAGDPDVPGPGWAGWLITAKLALAPVLAIAAVAFAVTNRLAYAIIAIAGLIIITWLTYLPSIAIQGIEFGGGFVGLQVVFQLLVAPVLAAVAIVLASTHQRLGLATALVSLPTVVGIASVLAFAIGIAIYGF